MCTLWKLWSSELWKSENGEVEEASPDLKLNGNSRSLLQLTIVCLVMDPEQIDLSLFLCVCKMRGLK